MDHSGHGVMDHSGHGGMDHSGHGGMDHSNHGTMDPMDHSDHGDMDMPMPKMGGMHGMHHMGCSGNDSMGGMSMSFHFGYDEVILFDWWSISDVGGLIGSMIGIFALATLYEGLKYWREDLMRKAIAKQQYVGNASKGTCGEENKQIQYMEQILMPPRVSMLSFPHAMQTLLHMLQMIVSYFLMLIFMTYNVWLCIAVVLGAGLGYFLFGWRKATVVDITEHCH
ncbi:high affinity copper uptake protein 1-like isoform X1 [Macrobrachium nipponense]|uniref:high affinity copper uptake protein 1-like isoform X1 n=1 Tax=Macrobrachium nipponense TaxID=159736 RepID=UPI0030C7A33F